MSQYRVLVVGRQISLMLILASSLLLFGQQERDQMAEVYRSNATVLPESLPNNERNGWLQSKPNTVVSGTPDLFDETVYRTIELVFSDPNWHQILIDNWEDHDQTGNDTYLKADLIVDGVTYPEVGVQYKGNSSFWFVPGMKKPYKITMDAFIEDQNLYGYEKITLNNGVWDPTMIREIICYKIMGKFMPAPRANLVRVRSGLAGDMMDIGVYTSVERVNKRFLRKHLQNDSGHRYKAHRGSMTWLGNDVAAYASRYNVSGGDEATEYLDLIDVINKLNNTPIANLRAELDPVFSIDRAIRQFTAGYALLNWDDLAAFAPNGHNYYTYQNTIYNQMMILPWDWDLGLSGSADEDIYDQFTDAEVPIVSRLMAVPELKERYLAFLKMMNDELLWSEIGTWVSQFRSQAETDILNGVHELYSDEEFFQSHQSLEDTIIARHNFVANHADVAKPRPTIADVAHQPVNPTKTDQVTVTARVTGSAPVGSVQLYYRVDGSFQSVAMMDDGNHGDGSAGDQVYGGFIPAQNAGKTVGYYVEAAIDAANGGGVWFEPIFTEHQPLTYEIAAEPSGSLLVINEFVAKNETGIIDEEGKFEDWVELYNGSPNDINLAGYFLTDDLTEPDAWEFPNVVIPAGGFLLIWCDKDLDDGPLHADFKLSTNGESIGLFSPASDGMQQLDAYTFGEQSADVSEGRLADGGSDWGFFQAPTPMRSNSTKLGDWNGDNANDILDLVTLVNAYGTCTAPCVQTCPTDLNADCKVDVADLVASLVFWRQ